MKRMIETFASLLILLVVSPVFIAAAICIRTESKGSVFYKQKRVGKDQKIFLIYKFRSMYAGSDAGGMYSTQRGDMRITKCGAYLRKYSIDELPQLINVLKGDMSIVGPRPDVPQQESTYSSNDWKRRCSVRPGITGLAQAVYRSNATPEQRIQLDLEYVDKQGLLLDIKIIILTIKRLFSLGVN